MYSYTDTDGSFVIESGSNAVPVFKVTGNVISISGSLIPAEAHSGSAITELGSIDYPWKELYVESASINFVNTALPSDHADRKTRFSKKDVDDLKAGKSLHSDGNISASGDMHVVGAFKVRGRTRIEGETDITGLTRLRGTTHVSGALSVKGDMDVQGAFSVGGNAISATELRSLAGLEASTAELNYTDGVTSAIQTQLDAKEATIGASNRVNATEVGTGVVSNTEFNYVNGVTSAIQTQLNAKATTAGVVGDLLPDADGTRDLGSTSKEWQDLWIDGTANIDTALIGDASITNTKMIGQIHINTAPTAISANGILDARTQNHFTIANNDVTGIRGSGLKGQIVTIVALGAYRPLLHHAENGVHANDRFMFAANRDVSLRGPAAMQVIYAGTGVGWYRLL